MANKAGDGFESRTASHLACTAPGEGGEEESLTQAQTLEARQGRTLMIEMSSCDLARVLSGGSLQARIECLRTRSAWPTGFAGGCVGQRSGRRRGKGLGGAGGVIMSVRGALEVTEVGRMDQEAI